MDFIRWIFWRFYPKPKVGEQYRFVEDSPFQEPHTVKEIKGNWVRWGRGYDLHFRTVIAVYRRVKP